MTTDVNMHALSNLLFSLASLSESGDLRISLTVHGLSPANAVGLAAQCDRDNDRGLNDGFRLSSGKDIEYATLKGTTPLLDSPDAREVEIVLFTDDPRSPGHAYSPES